MQCIYLSSYMYRKNKGMIFFNINAVLNVYWSSLTNDLWLIIQLYIVNITIGNFAFSFDWIFLPSWRQWQHNGMRCQTVAFAVIHA